MLNDYGPDTLFGLTAYDRQRLADLLEQYEGRPLNQRPQRRRPGSHTRTTRDPRTDRE